MRSCVLPYWESPIRGSPAWPIGSPVQDGSIVSAVPGTTRDVVERSFLHRGKTFQVLDTAGIRRKSRVQDPVEYYSVNRAIESIGRADLVFLTIDATEGLVDQDKKIAGQAVKEGRGVVIVLSKWDLLKNTQRLLEEVSEKVRFQFPVLGFAPIVPVSALTGFGVRSLLDTALEVWNQLHRRVGTGRLNQALEAWSAHYRLPVRGKNYKIRFMTQISANPVEFVVFVNRLSGFPVSYTQYLENCIRRDLGVPLVPVGIRVPAEQETRAMKSWSIGEVARFLGVKPHVIRYWESELPLLSPRKGLSGRREYSGSEIRLLLRFRHLLYDKKFTIEGAKGRLWEELGASADPDLAARFSEMRTDLIDALMTVRRAHGGNTTGEGEEMPEKPASSRMEKPASSRMEKPASSPMEPASSRMRTRKLTDGRRHQGKARLDGTGTPVRPLARAPRADEKTASRRPRRPRPLPCPDSFAKGSRRRKQVPAPRRPLRTLSPPLCVARRSSVDREAADLGEDHIRRGRTALLTVAGGQGSRLGFDGPKGMFPVTPLRRLTLFAWFAEKLLAARRRYGVVIPWLIMTGSQNHRATQEYFEKQEWFGLGRDTVRLFMQGSLPSLSPEGRLLLGPDGGLLVNPDGHGGVIDALRRSGGLAAMQEQGVEQLFYFQVDNPLVRAPDPVFLGFHCREGARISSKVIEKAYPEEKLGIIVTMGGKQAVIEYSDLDDARMHARDADGRLLYCQGSIAIHILEVAFLANPCAEASLAHRAKEGQDAQSHRRRHRNCREGRRQDGDVRVRCDSRRGKRAVFRDRSRGGVRSPEEPRGGGLRGDLPARPGGARGPMAHGVRRRGAPG